MVDTVEVMGEVMVEYFTNLFTATDCDMEEVVSCINSRIGHGVNDRLLRVVSQEEVRCSVFQMHPDKSPGPDGLGPGFYQHFWDILGGDVTLFCRDFIQTATLPTKANDTFIVLVPKKPNPDSMKDLRPIALCNVLYKIAAKVCANQMKSVLEGLINTAQSAFIPGRLITDNIMVAYEAHHYLKRKSQGRQGVAALKVDMSKAYDRVEWCFLRRVMLKMGFDPKWVEIIAETVRSAKYHVLHDQNQFGPIIPGRGLRQGDPLSPYLFLFITEGLSALLERQVARGLLHGLHVARGAPPVSHLLFADDCFLFFRASLGECETMKWVLDTYAKASGQLVNYDKSMVCFSTNTVHEERMNVTDILGVREGDTSEKYLGLPSLVGRKKSEILGYLKGKILSRIRSWNARFLSRAGREVLLKSVIHALPSYAMMVFLLPLGLCREIQTLMNEYWWTGTIGNGKGIRWWSWEGLCTPKRSGGMGFRKLHEMNKALLGKQAWRLLTLPNSLMSRVYKARYFPTCSYFDAKLGSNPSYIWRGLMEVQDLLRGGSRRHIGDGKTTRIGIDPWLPDSATLFVLTGLNETIAVAPVSSLFVVNRTEWDCECLGDIFEQRDVRLIMSIPLSKRLPPDSWFWAAETKGKYTVKSAYRMLIGEVADTRPWVRIWELEVPPKEESALHLFASCAEVRKIWSLLNLQVSAQTHVVMMLCGIMCLIQWMECYVLPCAIGITGGVLLRGCCCAYCRGALDTPGAWELKLNTDVAMDAGNGVMGMGWIVRDEHGEFVAAKCVTYPGLYGVKEAEAVGVRETLSWVKGLGFGVIDVETDSQLVFHALTLNTYCSSFGLVVDDVKEVASQIPDVIFYFARRSANRATHALAREAVSLSGCGEWYHEPPQFLVDILSSDLMH
ncbi:PREDICTED: uncharacterized protein LOC109180726 [Ipomoea nil]|uniref:uncharacterized protein LOC109180726 n=1 Tax=Ipomoea nil TaxID=35883 RepID=UPI00090112E2|nr:PREDICTED: uncharacterized protein LOC109180726 [Ipomoea nil]